MEILKKITAFATHKLISSDNSIQSPDLETARHDYEYLSNYVLQSGSQIRHHLPSLIFSPEDCITNQFLVELVANAAIYASKNTIQIPKANLIDNCYYNVFPGEHYRLLKAIANFLEPSTIVEVGTYTGMGTIALTQGFPSAQLFTYDIVTWDEFDTHLTNIDFEQKMCAKFVVI